VAAEAALFLSSRVFSDRHNAVVATIYALQVGARNIDLKNPAYAGKLGKGRVDLVRTLDKQGRTKHEIEDNEPPQLEVRIPDKRDGQVGTAYSVSLLFSGGVPPYRFATLSALR
jgi:hypothetical protein